jgi:hypothetical protein
VWTWRTMSDFSTLIIVEGAVAVAVTIRRGWLARQPPALPPLGRALRG